MDDRNYVLDYMDELKQLQPCTEKEEMILIEQLLHGDENAEGRLIEGNLNRVFELAEKRAGQGAPMGDLIQEGNMALVESVAEFRSVGVRFSGGSFRTFLDGRIEAAMDRLLNEEQGQKHAAGKLAEEANRLLYLTGVLEEELEREPSLAELAEKMGLPEDEVENIMRVSLSAAEMGDVGEPEEAEQAAPKSNPLKEGWDGF